MGPGDNWERVQVIFLKAADLRSWERAAYLDCACGGDAGLRAEVEFLLQEDAEAEAALDAAIQSEAVGLLEEPLLTGARLGVYRVIEEIGRGGMGSVYLAERDDDQYRKRVAIKVVKSMDTDEVLDRFRHERQILAGLEHPYIARLIDGGTAPDGRPFFVMEKVEGEPIDVYCRSRKLDLKSRLRLFLRVCEAVSHAHRVLVVHRDLKPGNILVTAEGIPKLLDFGIAKLLDPGADPGLTATLYGAGPLTPEYACPEQVRGLPVTTASDVYALGVILYELLTGTRAQKIDNPTPAEIDRVVCETQPLRPSTAARGLDGDLDNIVLMAMHKECERRYQSVEQLSADIVRYLSGQPVVAREDSFAYRAGKFLQRHKALVAGMTALFTVLIGGIVVSTSEATRARRAEQTAETIGDFLRNDLLAQASASAQAGQGTKPDADLKVRIVLDRAAARITGKLQPLVEASIRQTIGNTYFDLGLYPEAQRQLERAFDLQRRFLSRDDPDTLRTMNSLTALYHAQGKYTQAESLCTEVLQLRRRVLGEEHTDTLATVDRLAQLYDDQGKYAQAEPLFIKNLEIRRRVLGERHPNTLSSMNGLALLYRHEGKHELAEPLYTRALDGQRRVLGDEHPDTLATINNLAVLYQMRGKYTSAEPLFIKVLEVKRHVLGQEHPSTLVSMNNLGLQYLNEGKYSQAEPLFFEALEVRRRVLGEKHPNTLNSMTSLARLYLNQGKYAQAEPLFTKVLEEHRRDRGEEHPETLLSRNNLAVLYRAEGNYVLAEQLFTTDLGLQQRIQGQEHPDTLLTITNLGRLYQAQGKYVQAETLFMKVLGVRRRVLGPEHSDTMNTMLSLGTVQLAQRRYAEAESVLREALSAQVKVSSNTWQRYDTESVLGSSLEVQGKFAEAEQLLVAGYEGLIQRKAMIPWENRSALRQAGERIVQLYRNWGKLEKAAHWQLRLHAAAPTGRVQESRADHRFP